MATYKVLITRTEQATATIEFEGHSDAHAAEVTKAVTEMLSRGEEPSEARFVTTSSKYEAKLVTPAPAPVVAAPAADAPKPAEAPKA